jgi:protein TonB
MSDHRNKKRFLNMPRYTGGSVAFKEFIGHNLRYPEEALRAGVQGFVIVEYDILDDGSVRNARVIKPLGYGCDEEALRLIGMLRFEKVKNRGVRVRMTNKTRINFNLPGITITYHTPGSQPRTGDSKEPENNNPETYGYTITF